MDRIEMNTTSLQKHFPEVYRDFFARNDLVLSGCFSFPWTVKTHLRAKTTIGLKCYVWIKLTSNPYITFQDITFFDINKKVFETIEYNKVIKEESELKILIRDELSNLWIEKWLEIEILSETTRGHGFAFSGTSSAIIAQALYEIKDFFSGNKLQEMEEVFNISSKIDYLSRYGDTYGHNTIFTLNPNAWISMFYREIMNAQDKSIENIKKLSYEFKKVNWDWDLELPLDYFIVFSWLPSDTKQVEYYKKLENENDETFEFVSKNIAREDKNYELNLFSDKNHILKTKEDIVTLQNIKLLEIIQVLYKKPHDENIIESLIHQFNNIRNAVSLLEKQSNFSEDFLFSFRQCASHKNEMIWICPSYTGKLWGSYIMVTKSWISRKTVMDTLEKLKTMYPNIEAEYVSYEDGTSQDKVKVEQFISAGMYSKYVDKNKVIYTNNKWKNILWNYGDFIEAEIDGLLFDMIHNKIYLNGEKLTSKDIPSQNTTIEVITKLLENIGEEISNKDLPVSSYTSNKNEMLGKIILPLLKLVEEKTWEKLSLVCKWGITDFYIKMWTINLKIWIIKKI